MSLENELRGRGRSLGVNAEAGRCAERRPVEGVNDS